MLSKTERPAVAPAADEKLVWVAPTLDVIEARDAKVGAGEASDGVFSS